MSSRLCQGVKWVIGHLAWSLRAPLAPSPVFILHPLHFPHSSSSHLLTLFIYSLSLSLSGLHEGRVEKFFHPSPSLRVFTHLRYFMSTLMRTVTLSLRHWLSARIYVFHPLTSRNKYVNMFKGWTDPFYNLNWQQPTHRCTCRQILYSLKSQFQKINISVNVFPCRAG